MNDLSKENTCELLCKELLRDCERFFPVRIRRKRKISPRDGRILMRKKTRLANRITAFLKVMLTGKMYSLERRLIASLVKEKRYAELKTAEAVKKKSKVLLQVCS